MFAIDLSCYLAVANMFAIYYYYCRLPNVKTARVARSINAPVGWSLCCNCWSAIICPVGLRLFPPCRPTRPPILSLGKRSSDISCVSTSTPDAPLSVTLAPALRKGLQTSWLSPRIMDSDYSDRLGHNTQVQGN